MDVYQYYSLGYQSARKKFCKMAEAMGGELHHYLHPDQKGPDGEDLFADVAVFGRSNASKRLLIVSGTHGLEGFFGSAAQLAWIKNSSLTRPDDVAVIMLHAINPWGFAYKSRTTEHNVDLNRNFMDFDHGSLPQNKGYDALHHFLLSDDWGTQSEEKAQKAMQDFTAGYGADHLYDSLAKGQYSQPQGLSFGGLAREWSNHVLERIVRTHLLGADKVGFIDWHTGIGEYGEPFFLCFSESGTELHRQAVKWWGKDRIVDQQPHGRARPNYQGLLIQGVQDFLDDVPLCGAVVEIGTRGWHMRRMLRLDLWLKFKAERPSERYAMHEADLMDAFCPVDEIWRISAVTHALHITEQALTGLSAWGGGSR